jgi:hypothetical protein
VELIVLSLGGIVAVLFLELSEFVRHRRQLGGCAALQQKMAPLEQSRARTRQLNSSTL